ncbi:unnamed protein product [Paramecium sonneborni]|uniref:Uncharacterized protein n=1 Tax=Paramecium sonneborni TaxID=65129 RepID=A0A8S1R6A9_9CILI|nr:unnamed protein product [Paramecium sonneborni]
MSQIFILSILSIQKDLSKFFIESGSEISKGIIEFKLFKEYIIMEQFIFFVRSYFSSKTSSKT